MTLLSIIVPVSRLSGELGNLKSWLGKALDLGVEAILVHDVQDKATSVELHEIQTEANSEGLQLIEGNYGSPGAARNMGIKVSTGQWVMFWDGDDVGEIENVLHEIATQAINSLDAIVFQYDIRQIGIMANDYVVNRNTETLNMISTAVNPGLWRICFNGDLVRKFQFLEISMAEDQMFLVSIDFSNLRIYYSKRLAYHYYRGRSGQLTRNPKAIKDLAVTIQELKSQMSFKPSYFIAILLIRQSITAIKRGRNQLKFAGLVSIFWLIFSNPRISIYSAYQIKVYK